MKSFKKFTSIIIESKYPLLKNYFMLLESLLESTDKDYEDLLLSWWAVFGFSYPPQFRKLDIKDRLKIALNVYRKWKSDEPEDYVNFALRLALYLERLNPIQAAEILKEILNFNFTPELIEKWLDLDEKSMEIWETEPEDEEHQKELDELFINYQKKQKEIINAIIKKEI